jgi:peptide chain release factor 1
VPPSEKRGRVHTSTITVAVLHVEARGGGFGSLKKADVDEKTTKGSGAGGQHRNKTESVVVVTHRPTGIVVRCESQRSQHQNRVVAWALLDERVRAADVSQQKEEREAERRAQLGSGMRGDKVRTIRIQDGVVTDEPGGRKITWRRYQRGDWEGLFGPVSATPSQD